MNLPILGRTKQSERKLSRLQLFWILYVAFSATQLSLTFLGYQTEWKHRFNLLAQSQKNLILLEDEKVFRSLERISYDLVFLAEIAEASSFDEAAPLSPNLTDTFEKLGSVNQRYDQIRILNLSGREVFRLNYKDGMMFQVPPEALQDKSDRYYFQTIREGEQDTLYFFDMDLNVENGVVEEPYNPVIRAGMALKGPEGEVTGYLVLNHRAQMFLNNLRDNENVLESRIGISLLNSRGYWLIGPERVVSWGFMFPYGQEDRLSLSDPDLWERMSSESMGQYFREGGLYTYRAIRLGEILSSIESRLARHRSIRVEDLGHEFYLLYHMDREVLNGIRKGILLGMLPSALLFQILLIGLSLLIAEMVIQGRNYRKQLLHYASVDELTGCLNRRSGTQLLNRLLSQERRRGSFLTIAYMDINNLKFVNDNLGHDEGDRYILMMVNMVREYLRAGDLLVRMGGDEFLIILPDCRLEQASHIRERMKEQEERINETMALAYHASFSWGAVDVSPKDEREAEEIISCADTKMYEEKKAYHRKHPKQPLSEPR